jgi:PAS domain S-box-containing protein
MKFLKGMLTPPVFEDEFKTHQAYLLNIILWGLILIPIPYVLYGLIATPENKIRVLIQGGFGETINVILLYLLHRGHVWGASILQVSMFWLFFTVSGFTGAGTRGEEYLLGYPLVIGIAGILLGGRAALIVTLLSLVTGGFMVYAEAHDILISNNSKDPFSAWVISLVIFPMSAVLQQLAARDTRNALARARASEERYRLISEITSDYTFSTEFDAQGNQSAFWASGAFEKITGFTVDEYLKMGDWLSRIHPDDLDQDAKDGVMLRNNQSVMTEIRLYRKDGDLRWLRIYANPIWNNAENRLARVVGAVQDITERKRAEEFERRRRTMLEKVVQLGKQVTEVNDLRTTLEKIWHGVHDELGFDRLAIFLYNAERNTMDDTFGTNNQGEMIDVWDLSFPIMEEVAEATTFYRVLRRPDGFYFTHEYDVAHQIPKGHDMYGVKDFAAVAAWAGNKPVAVICVDHLITGRSITDEQLEALRLFAGYAGLAIENARLNSALQVELAQRQNLIEELEAKNAELERFTYTVSHDLKSPLVTISGFLGYLEKDFVSGNVENIKSSITRITIAVQKMKTLLDDLLELSRIGRVINAPEAVNFSEIVGEALERVQGRLDQNKIRVNVQKRLPIVHGDRVRLIEVMQNLVENAAKFTGASEQPSIEIGSKGIDRQGKVILFVQDNGIGIQPQFQERIFGLFNKLDQNVEGTGIGLALVKRIIEVHGGKIWVESEPDRGATFYFTLTSQNEE